ncbi:MAG: type II toxin-antitoxin system PemK/MazF family toxin [Intrasporangium sp.]|uniref:type II toxin-antitoxin system PemK/MazF family toxin n=1 Tax=Intrasporangium sp. TaxID=1925024 RepID=UPI00264702C1|nr:type II toxin-antitoxin system PemK/MazF family toxin [Intrasporangium sp.]MDN5796367.1 type II toxin-antitoxin system PemK/MazF family toxin [Intrasporangium sp.]
MATLRAWTDSARLALHRAGPGHRRRCAACPRGPGVRVTTLVVLGAGSEDFTGQLLRGSIYAAKLDHIPTEKYFLVVSNNSRNKALANVLAVRLTSKPKPPLTSIVEMSPGDPLGGGRIVCDDIVELWPDEVRAHKGTLTAKAMRKVDSGLKAALGLA